MAASAVATEPHILVFDSGLGGLSVTRAIRAQAPAAGPTGLALLTQEPDEYLRALLTREGFGEVRGV